VNPLRLPFRHRAPVVLIAIAVVAGSCGRKGPPLAPLRLVPAAPADASVQRLAGDVVIRFVLPARNLTGEGRVDLDHVEIYAVTAAPGAVIPANRDLLTKKYLVGTIAVKPPPVGDDTAVAAEAEDKRPSAGESVTFIETLTEETMTPAPLPLAPVPPPALPTATPGVPVPMPGVAVPLPDVPAPAGAGSAPTSAPAVSTPTAATPTAAAPAGAVPAPAVPAAAVPAVEPLPTYPSRIYILRGITRSGRPGAPSARLRVPIVAPPPRPAGVAARNTEGAVVVEWTALSTAAGAPSPSYNVYTPDRPVPLNAEPLSTPAFERAPVEFGTEQCFAVRAVERVGGIAIEGELSAPFCFTPRDTFPPAAPTGLTAVADDGVITLVWDPNTESDLAGYLVLRGEAPGDKLGALAAPIRDTSYADKAVKPGVNYVYVIVAVDNATPPNMSPQSEKVLVAAR
jgi:hypothetical protein